MRAPHVAVPLSQQAVAVTPPAARSHRVRSAHEFSLRGPVTAREWRGKVVIKKTGLLEHVYQAPTHTHHVVALLVRRGHAPDGAVHHRRPLIQTT